VSIWNHEDTLYTSAVLGGPYASTVTVDPDSATPLYVQVASLLRARIQSGELTARLPSLRTITQEYGVSHITAEKAVLSLREAGLVVTVVGRGTFVARTQAET
jgi:GntR family transcriptional regulator